MLLSVEFAGEAVELAVVELAAVVAAAADEDTVAVVGVVAAAASLNGASEADREADRSEDCRTMSLETAAGKARLGSCSPYSQGRTQRILASEVAAVAGTSGTTAETKADTHARAVPHLLAGTETTAAVEGDLTDVEGILVAAAAVAVVRERWCSAGVTVIEGQTQTAATVAVAAADSAGACAGPPLVPEDARPTASEAARLTGWPPGELGGSDWVSGLLPPRRPALRFPSLERPLQPPSQL